MMRRAVGVAAIVLCAVALVAAPEKKDDATWEAVAAALGKKGDLSTDAVYKVTFPRNDLKVTMHGAPVPVGMGLASWAAFTKMPDGKYMVMGDTVMLGAEVNPAIDALRAGGIEVVALHNHMLGEQPQIMFMHYQGEGDAEALARTIRRAIDQLGKPR
ncbi:MAG: DUF1259 domain-containing protein [Candidatus Acidiferrales bacterium]